jgi:para-nitrobenzyl esterase
MSQLCGGYWRSKFVQITPVLSLLPLISLLSCPLLLMFIFFFTSTSMVGFSTGMAMMLSVVVMILFASSYVQASLALPENQIQLDTGVIEGIVESGYRVFRGIPYAEPPVGSLRWQNPRAKQAWPGVLQCYKDRNGCVQNCDFPPATRACPNTTGEDCLFLTVYTPRLSELATPAPIMIFYHGGEFVTGHGGGELWSGKQMSSMTGTILVGVNYRLGAMSWAWNGHDLAGNYGIRDQILALEWVQRNAAAIGGDPKRVTIFGQSAGGKFVSISSSCG